jgi:hypothetical protein
MAEANPLKGLTCGFESRRGHLPTYTRFRSLTWRFTAKGRVGPRWPFTADIELLWSCPVTGRSLLVETGTEAAGSGAGRASKL